MKNLEKIPSQLTFLAKINFLLLGLATLIGWNAVLSSIDFFTSKFPEYNISFIMLIPSFIATFIFSLFASYFSKIISLNKRIFGSIITMSICLLILPFEAYFLPNKAGFIIFVLLNFVISAFIAIMQATCVGLAFIFPYEAMSLFNTGIGFSGILMSLLRITYLLIINDNDETHMMYSMVIFFSSAVFFLLLALIIHAIFIKSQYFKGLSKLLTRLSYAINREEINIEEGSSLSEKYEEVRKDEENEINEINQKLLLPELVFNENDKNLTNIDNAIYDKTQVTNMQKNPNFFQVLIISFKAAWPYSILLSLLYLQTFALFPGVLLLKQIYGLNTTWNPVLLILIYNIFDTMGKYIGVIRIFFTKIRITIFVVVRCLFFATFLLNVQNKYSLSFLTSDWFCLFNLGLFAVSNGYLTTALFILGSESYTKAQQKEKVGFMMSFMFNIGCIGGSLLALSFSNFNN